MKRALHKRSDEEGVALILALLFVVLMTVMVIEFSYEAQVEASFAANQSGDLEAYLAAKSAVAQGIALLQGDLFESETDGLFFDSYDDIWAQPDSFKPMNEALMRTTISDEYGKINLNALLIVDGEIPVERPEMVAILTNFFGIYDPEMEEEPQVVVASIINWLDYGDDDDDHNGDGAENDFYQAAEIPYACKNSPMDSIEELLLIRGITPKLYYGDPEKGQLPLYEYLTVHGDWAGRINVNTVQRFIDDPNADATGTQDFVLQAVSNGLSEVGLIVNLDSLYARLEQEEPLRDVSELNSFVKEEFAEGTQAGRQEDTRRQTSRQGRRQGARQDQNIDLSDEVFTVQSNVFRIYGDGMVGDTLVRIEAYVWRTPTNWQQFYDPIIASESTTLSIPMLQQQQEPQERYRILQWKVIR